MTQTANQVVFGILCPGKLVCKFLLIVIVNWILLLLVDITFWERQTSITGNYVEFLKSARDGLVGDERQCIKYSPVRWKIHSLFQSGMVTVITKVIWEGIVKCSRIIPYRRQLDWAISYISTLDAIFFTCFGSIVGSDSKEKTAQDETINVFSVASGHLYERFLRYEKHSRLKRCHFYLQLSPHLSNFFASVFFID